MSTNNQNDFWIKFDEQLRQKQIDCVEIPKANIETKASEVKTRKYWFRANDQIKQVFLTERDDNISELLKSIFGLAKNPIAIQSHGIYFSTKSIWFFSENSEKHPYDVIC
jgi:hypothetical protein